MSTLRQIQEFVSKRLAFFVAIGVASFSVVLWQALIAQEHAQIKRAVEHQAFVLQSQIIERIEPKILALERMARRWEIRGGTPREEWEADGTRFIADQTGQRVIIWVDSSYIVRWVIPSRGRSPYTGRNLAREERQRVALEAARETREVKVTLADDPFSDDRGMLVFVPLFVGERFDGTLQGVFHIAELLDPLLSEHASLGFSISVADDEKDIASRTTSDRQEYLQWLQETEVEIRNVTWHIQVWPGPKLVADMQSSLPEVALVSGLLLALLMSLTVRLARTARIHAQGVEETNQELEGQITERKRAEEALRKLQARLHHLLSASPAVIHSCKPSGDFDTTFISENVTAQMGYPARAFIEDSRFWADRIHPEDAPRIFGNIPSLFEQGHLSHEYRFRCPDGTYRWMSDQMMLIRDALGKPLEIVGCWMDITEHKRAEETLRESQANLAEAQRIARVGSWKWDIQNDKASCSEEFYRIFGLPQEEFINYEQYMRCVHLDDREALGRDVEAALSSGEPFDRLYRIVLPDGSERVIHSRSEVTLDETGKPIRMIGTAQDISARRRAEEALQFTQFVSDHSPVAVYWMDSEARITYVNDAATRATGYSREELLSMSVPDLNPDYSPETWPEVWKKRKEHGSQTFETHHRAKDGRIVPVEVTAYYLEFQGKEYNCSLVQDITERKRAEEALRQKEEQLRETQKLEAVGTLAGGVAHEFNNLLTGIIGYSELLLKKSKRDPLLSKRVEEIKKAGEKAASLTSQLLAFSRKQVLQPQVLDLNEIVTELNETLRGLMGEDIVMMTSLSPGLGRTKADADQMRQIILSLASNARSAMPRGGKFILATENAELSEDDESGIAGAHAVRHVLLTVSDTGSGMNAETLSHVFEPFFTTKEVGAGTGLGLASVYGIVQQSGGRIQVSSEPGRGTKFQIYMPRVDKPASPPKRAAARKQRSGGAKTVLLVEDTIQVRQMVRLFLQRAGYTVLEASNGFEALQVAKQSKQPIHMLLTDVIMPEMNGPDLAARLAEDRKNLKVLYMSGYSNHPVVQESVLKSGASFIAKPFAPEALLQKVREVFDTPAKVGSQRKPHRVRT